MNINKYYDQNELERKIDRLKLCGVNRGPHDYIPISKSLTESEGTVKEEIMMLLCRVCFCRVNTKTIYENFSEIKI